MMDEPNDGSRRATVAAVIAVVLLVVGGLWLTSHIRAMTAIQDCVMEGRRNCAPVGR